MTREKFVTAAIRKAEKDLGVPAGWWGAYRDVRGPGGRRVYFGRMLGVHGWIVARNGKVISGHDSRKGAIGKAAKL